MINGTSRLANERWQRSTANNGKSCSGIRPLLSARAPTMRWMTLQRRKVGLWDLEVKVHSTWAMTSPLVLGKASNGAWLLTEDVMTERPPPLIALVSRMRDTTPACSQLHHWRFSVPSSDGHFISGKASSGKALAANNRPLTFSACCYTHAFSFPRTIHQYQELLAWTHFLSITLSYRPSISRISLPVKGASLGQGRSADEPIVARRLEHETKKTLPRNPNESESPRHRISNTPAIAISPAIRRRLSLPILLLLYHSRKLLGYVFGNVILRRTRTTECTILE